MRRQAPNILGIAAFVRTPWLGQDPRACVGKVQSTFTHHAPLCYTMHPRKSWAGFTFHLMRKLRAPSKFQVKDRDIQIDLSVFLM